MATSKDAAQTARQFNSMDEVRAQAVTAAAAKLAVINTRKDTSYNRRKAFAILEALVEVTGQYDDRVAALNLSNLIAPVN